MPEQARQNRWYDKGLRFQCTQCGDCCTGAPGFVWVNKEEIEAIASYRGEAVDQIRSQYVREVGIRRSLRERANGDCVFLDAVTRACTIYEVRPRQCRSWPFWNSNLRSQRDWQYTCDVCPGAGRGRLVPVEEIEAQAALIRI